MFTRKKVFLQKRFNRTLNIGLILQTAQATWNLEWPNGAPKYALPDSKLNENIRSLPNAPIHLPPYYLTGDRPIRNSQPQGHRRRPWHAPGVLAWLVDSLQCTVCQCQHVTVHCTWLTAAAESDVIIDHHQLITVVRWTADRCTRPDDVVLLRSSADCTRPWCTAPPTTPVHPVVSVLHTDTLRAT